MINDITQPKQLLVEGNDAVNFFYPFIDHLNIPDIQIQNFESVGDFRKFIGLFSKNSNFRNIVTSVGIVRDAEQTIADNAFRSICDAIVKVGLVAPSRVMEFSEAAPRIGVYILPDGTSPGMLETLLLGAVFNDPAFGCIDSFITCVQETKNYIPQPPEKAKLLAYFASRERVKPLIGYSARAGYLNFDHAVYDQLKTFIKSL
ncbi:MAG: DUF3226 domain-containing protein [Chloroflexota bacterium]